MGWKEQDKALIGQLERIFDDIYKRFGRLAWEDLGTKLQETITNLIAGSVTAVTWDTVNKKLTVTINNTTSDVVTIATIKTALALSFDDIVSALGYTPPQVDTKNTTGTTNKTGTKMFLAAATEQSANPVTYSNSNCYIGTDNCLYSGGTKVLTSHQDISSKADKTTTVNGHALSSNVTVTKSDVGLGNVTNDSQVKRSEMGAASGVATLDSAGKVPSSQLPSYVDDVLEYDTKSAFPETGEAGKIYVDKSILVCSYSI